MGNSYVLLQWSKACYSYVMAVCLIEIGGGDNIKEAAKLMEQVSSDRSLSRTYSQKIAGKSIPLEARNGFLGE